MLLEMTSAYANTANPILPILSVDVSSRYASSSDSIPRT